MRGAFSVKTFWGSSSEDTHNSKLFNYVTPEDMESAFNTNNFSRKTKFESMGRPADRQGRQVYFIKQELSKSIFPQLGCS